MLSLSKKLSIASIVCLILFFCLPNPITSWASPNAAANIFSPPLGYGQSTKYSPRVTFDNTGLLIETTDYGIQNPDLSHFSACFNLNMRELLHAGEDWYRMDGLSTAGALVTSVADGTVYDITLGNYPGYAIVIEHLLPSGQFIYSVYMHIENIPVGVIVGQPVLRGQMIGTVLDQPYDGLYSQYHSSDDSHLHFEIRYFASAANIYSDHPNCNFGDVAGRGYTFPGYHPDAYPNSSQHFTDPGSFIRSRAGLFLPSILKSSCTNGQQLLTNRGFENGREPWVEELQGYPVITNYLLPNPAHNGTWVAWFGGRNNATESIYQQFPVLPGMTAANFSYFYWMRTDGTFSGAYDKLYVRLRDNNGNFIREIDYLDNNSYRYSWVSHTLLITNLAAYQGQILRLSFEGVTDPSYITSFLIDDVSLTVICSGAQAPQLPEEEATPTNPPQATPTGANPTKPVAPTSTVTPTSIPYP